MRNGKENEFENGNTVATVELKSVSFRKFISPVFLENGTKNDHPFAFTELLFIFAESYLNW
jgi:hypothetical protein